MPENNQNIPYNSSLHEQAQAPREGIISVIDAEMTTYRDYPQVAVRYFPEAAIPLNLMQEKNEYFYHKVLLRHEAPTPRQVELERGDSRYDDEATLIKKGVREWYQTLGSFNSLKNGGDDLLRGALIVLGNNNAADYRYPEGQKSSMLEAFKELTELNDFTEQEPNEHLVLAGQMVHEAALLETDVTERKYLFNKAAALYRRVYADESVGWEYKFKRDAAKCLYAINFQLLGEGITTMKDTDRVKAFRASYEGSASKCIALFAEAYKAGAPNGELAEWFETILAHDIAITEQIEGRQVIMPAFLRQDEPHDKISRQYQRHAFDLRVGDKLIQIKAFEAIHEADYISEIKVLGMKVGDAEEARRTMLETLQALDRIYKGIATDNDFNLLTAQEAPLIKLLKSA